MFFARLAIAALSFGSFAQVFAAPIAKDVSVSLPVGLSVDRRAVDFLSAVDTAKGSLSDIKAKLDSISGHEDNAESVVGSTLSQVAPVLTTLGASIKSTGVEGFANGSAEPVAKEMASVLTLVVSITENAKRLNTVTLLSATVTAEVENIVAELNAVLAIVKLLAPQVLAIIAPLLVTIFDVVHGVVSVVGGILGAVVSGGL
ncbi:hypothetical protein RhiJN_00402 [Ceratobasidium sp. AG-Ba]|nr:hypothetical protein RhiJN_00402 [Ceratobasidium sp. AG-Ba]QRW01430.1 hypothetical protein RhiLY_00427 [Ceratobasidium sp. AG-Ba]